MKYIRTKDGHIYEVISKDVAEFGDETYEVQGYICKSKTKSSAYKPYIDEYKVIKQADTIEELCDCFIAVDKNGNLCENPMIAKGHCFKSFCNYYKAKGIDVDCYLAILTDEGLIYVAKLNKKGELELL